MVQKRENGRNVLKIRLERPDVAIRVQSILILNLQKLNTTKNPIKTNETIAGRTNTFIFIITIFSNTISVIFIAV